METAISLFYGRQRPFTFSLEMSSPQGQPSSASSRKMPAGAWGWGGVGMLRAACGSLKLQLYPLCGAPWGLLCSWALGQALMKARRRTPQLHLESSWWLGGIRPAPLLSKKLLCSAQPLARPHVTATPTQRAGHTGEFSVHPIWSVFLWQPVNEPRATLERW